MKVLFSIIFYVFSLSLFAQENYSIARKNVFEFVVEPFLSEEGGKVKISFTTKDFCDTTICIEDQAGNIVRHIASGVLGKNAPEPFIKNSLVQEIFWDKKDERGQYVKQGDLYFVRVSLGLDVEFDQSIFWSPKKRSSNNSPLLQATAEGVYVLDEGRGVAQLGLFDSMGKYVKTVYPFPAEKIASIKGLHWKEFEGGYKVPLRLGGLQATLLNSGNRSEFDGKQGVGSTHSPLPFVASSFATNGKKIAVSFERVNRFSVDGGGVESSLYGPEVCLKVIRGGRDHLGGGKEFNVGPRSSAISSDGKWIYYTGFVWHDEWGTGGQKYHRIHAVTRMPYDGSVAPELFAGNLEPKKAGSMVDELKVPVAVLCADDGRVLVSDYMNDRIQVYSEDKKLIKSIPAFKPTQFAIHHKTKELYVFSWYMEDELIWSEKREDEFDFKPCLTIYESVDNPVKKKTIDLPLHHQIDRRNGTLDGGLAYQAVLDSWSERPTVWLVPQALGKYAKWKEVGIKVYELVDSKLELRHDFGNEVEKKVVRVNPTMSYLRQRLYVNPKNGDLYIAEGDAGVGKSVGVLLKVDAKSGVVSEVSLPYDAEDFAFDLDGNIYLRALKDIGRFDPETWREVPWDYGAEKKSVNFASSKNEGAGMRRSSLISSVLVPANRYNHHGGIKIAANGNMVVATHGGQEFGNEAESKDQMSGELPPEIQVYPGRSMCGLVQIFDRHGKLINKDAIPGLAFTHGIGIDNENMLYSMAMVTRLISGKVFDNMSTNTLIKINPVTAKIISSSQNQKFVPITLKKDSYPAREADIYGSGGGRLEKSWVEGAVWFFGGVGFNGRNTKTVAPPLGCDCQNSRFDLDYYGRSFAPELDRYSVVVLDKNGQIITRIGSYGNVDSKGVGLFYFPYVAVQTDKKLFIADIGNHRIVSVNLVYKNSKKLGYVSKITE